MAFVSHSSGARMTGESHNWCDWARGPRRCEQSRARPRMTTSARRRDLTLQGRHQNRSGRGPPAARGPSGLWPCPDYTELDRSHGRATPRHRRRSHCQGDCSITSVPRKIKPTAADSYALGRVGSRPRANAWWRRPFAVPRLGAWRPFRPERNDVPALAQPMLMRGCSAPAAPTAGRRAPAARFRCL
jgi:hypothetical protein